MGFLVSSPPGLPSTHPAPGPRRARRGAGVGELRSQAGEETHKTCIANVHVQYGKIGEPFAQAVPTELLPQMWADGRHTTELPRLAQHISLVHFHDDQPGG